MSDASTLLRLDSMTLRGVGSYFHGAELKVRPLTILCGTNGSGKSTWFNAIELLQRSLSKGMLPFGFDADDGDCHDMQWTNARVNSAALPDLVEDATTADRFGPWGTIGASSTAVGDVRGSQQDGSWRVHDHVAARLLWLGVCVKGDRFRLRLAHSSEGMNEYHQDFIELVFNDIYTIRMIRPRKDRVLDARHPPYLLECSRGFLSDDGDDELVSVARFDWGVSQSEYHVVKADAMLPDGMSAEALITRCVDLIRALWDRTLRGFFPVTAIRDRQERASLEKSVIQPALEELLAELQKPRNERTLGWSAPGTSEQLISRIRDELNDMVLLERVKSRHVGPHGEAALPIWRRYSENEMSDAGRAGKYTLSQFVSFWLRKLLEISIYDAPELPRSSPSSALCGYLSNLVPNPPAERQWPEESTWEDFRRFMHPCLTQSQGPSRLSAGFHQLFPIVMQVALLQRGEIVAIENPEVHLHPSLQLAVAEFLMHQALGGKTILVETHSDLIIRRLLRAVLEEQLPQEALNIQFVSLAPAKNGAEAHSISEPLRINEKGRIENWPEGFLDDDIKESRRLFEIMYGTMPETDQEEPG